MGARQDTLFVFILFHTSQKKQNHEKTQSLKNATTFCRIDYIIAATCRRRRRLLRYLLLAFLNLGCICVDQISNQINKRKKTPSRQHFHQPKKKKKKKKKTPPPPHSPQQKKKKKKKKKS